MKTNWRRILEDLTDLLEKQEDEIKNLTAALEETQDELENLQESIL